MITAEIHENGNHTVWTVFRAPAVYLDTCAIRELSNNPQKSKIFTDSLIAKNGTFLISYASVIEIGRMMGDSLDKIQKFFNNIGTFWFPIDCNPSRVIDRETSHSKQPACLDTEFLENYYPQIHNEPLRLTKLIDLIRDGKDKFDNSHQDAASLAIHTTSLRKAFKARHPAINQKAYLTKVYDPDRPTIYVYHGLMRYMFESNMRVNTNDVFDIWHTAVPLAYASFLVVDKKWCNIARTRLPELPRDEKWIFDIRELDEFLETFEAVRFIT